MRVRQDDHLCFSRYSSADFLRLDLPSVFLAPVESLQFEPQISRDIEQRSVCRKFQHDFVPGIQKRAHDEMIRHRSPFGLEDAFRTGASMMRDCLLKRRGSVNIFSVNFYACEISFQETQWKRGYSAAGEIEAGETASLCPLHIGRFFRVHDPTRVLSDGIARRAQRM